MSTRHAWGRALQGCPASRNWRSVGLGARVFYFTATFTCALDQQHWKPRPPSPDASFATTRKMYSPASLNVAVVAAVPLNTAGGGGLNSALATGGRSLENVTVPGPRNLLQVTVTGVLINRGMLSVDFASSASHRGSVRGRETVVESSRLWPRGPWTNGPDSEKAMNGGVLPLASVNGWTSYIGCKLIGITVVFPFDTNVQ